MNSTTPTTAPVSYSMTLTPPTDHTMREMSSGERAGYIGKLVPAFSEGILPKDHSEAISTLCNNNKEFLKTKKVQVFVGARDACDLTIEANRAVELWAEHFIEKPVLVARGFNIAAGSVAVQTHGFFNIFKGAENRMELLKEASQQYQEENSLKVFLSMENGLIQENVRSFVHPELFHPKFVPNGFFPEPNYSTWVDRCLVLAQVEIGCLKWSAHSLSIGVSLPYDCVEESAKTDWTKTAASFIAQKYNFKEQDWHGMFSGKGKDEIVSEAIKKTLGISI